MVSVCVWSVGSDIKNFGMSSTTHFLHSIALGKGLGCMLLFVLLLQLDLDCHSNLRIKRNNAYY